MCFDLGGFGKILLLKDPEADYDSLYPRKLVHEATGTLASVIKSSVTFNKGKMILTRPLDYVGLSRMSSIPPTVLKQKSFFHRIDYHIRMTRVIRGGDQARNH